LASIIGRPALAGCVAEFVIENSSCSVAKTVLHRDRGETVSTRAEINRWAERLDAPEMNAVGLKSGDLGG
jgi:hypothetical protein